MDSNHSSGARSKLLSVQLLLLIWAPAALAGIYTKWAILRWDGYFKTAISLGRRPILGVDSSVLFTAGEKLSFFRADLLLCIIFVPMLLWVLSGWLRPRLLSSLVAIISIGWIAVITVQLEAFRQIGNFQSLELLDEGLNWAIKNPRQAGSYILGMAVIRLVIPVSMVLIAAALALSPKFRSSNWLPRCQPFASVALIVLLSITALAWLPWMPTTACHFSVHLATVRALPSPRSASTLASLSIAELKQKYRQISAAPETKRDPARWAKARDYDVLFFILETTPTRCVSFTTPIDDLPNMRALREHAWIGARHNTTYPLTSRAIFSLLTSLYPGDNTKDTVMLRDYVKTGVIHELAEVGYQTGVYGSSASIVPKELFKSLGFARFRAVDEGRGSRAWAVLGIDGSLEPAFDNRSYVVQQQRLDLLALNQLKIDMTAWIKKNQRFAAVYLPQISHAPWGDPRPDKHESNLIARCRGLAQIQDEWLGDLLNLLQENGRMGRTLILVTGDHGIRTSMEDPSLSVGVTDAYTFEVPMMLYAPGVVEATTTIPWVTSHIDVAPSILDLLGIARNTDTEQGTAVWDERIRNRATYFLASLYTGADGYYTNGRFFSWNRVLDTAYESDSLHFEPAQIILDKAARESIKSNLLEFDEVRTAWIKASQK